MNKFVKVSEQEYIAAKGIDNYASIKLPELRATHYQILSTINLTIRPGKIIHIPTGIACELDEGYAFKIYPSHARFGSYLQGTIEIVDNTYAAHREGHIIISLTNNCEQDLTIEEGEQIAIATLSKCLLATNDEAQAPAIVRMSREEAKSLPPVALSKEAFCKKYKLTEAQFTGQEPIRYLRNANKELALPAGFNPNVEQDLDLRSVLALSEGFSPTVGGDLNLEGLTAVADDFNPTVGGRLLLTHATAIAENFSPKAGSLYLNSLKEITGNFSPRVTSDLMFDELTSISGNFSPVIGSGDLKLEKLTTIKGNFSPIIGASIELPALVSIDGDFSPRVEQALDLRSLANISGRFKPEVGSWLNLDSLKSISGNFDPVVGDSLTLNAVISLPNGTSIAVGRDLSLKALAELPAGAHFKFGGDIYLNGLNERPASLDFIEAGEYSSIYLKAKLINRGGEQATSMGIEFFKKEFIEQPQEEETAAPAPIAATALSKEEFCQKYSLTEAQFTGEEIMNNDNIADEQLLPDGFSPLVRGNLYLDNLLAIPAGFNPIVSKHFSIGSVVTIPADFSPSVGGELSMKSVTAIPPTFNPKMDGAVSISNKLAEKHNVDSYLSIEEFRKAFTPSIVATEPAAVTEFVHKKYMEQMNKADEGEPTVATPRVPKAAAPAQTPTDTPTKVAKTAGALTKEEFCKKYKLTEAQFAGQEEIVDLKAGDTSLPEGFSPNVKRDLFLNNLTTIPAGFNPTVGKALLLNGLTEIPADFKPIVGKTLYLNGLIAVPKGFTPDAQSISLRASLIGKDGDKPVVISMEEFKKLFA